MLRGFATVSYYADDTEAARAWYADLLGIGPYFSVPCPDGGIAYYEFRVGDYKDESGLLDARFAPPGSRDRPGGEIIYWHVDDLQGSYDRLLARGATSYQPPIERGPGFVTASVVDPFGNIRRLSRVAGAAGDAGVAPAHFGAGRTARATMATFLAGPQETSRAWRSHTTLPLA